MNVLRPKLTRRRGACEECRQKKVRCDGANLCNHCQRNKDLCKYNSPRSRRRLHGKSAESFDNNVSTATPPQATTRDTISDSTSLIPSSEAGVDQQQALEVSENPLRTPFTEEYLSQVVSDSAQTHLDFNFPDGAVLGDNQAENIYLDHSIHDLQSQRLYDLPRSDTPVREWLEAEFNQHLHQQSTGQLYDLSYAEGSNPATPCTLALLSGRMIADKAETKSIFSYKMHGVTALFQNSNRGSRRQQTVLDKVTVLLSLEHQPSLFQLLRKTSSIEKAQSLDLHNLPVEKLVQKAFQELGGLRDFMKEQDVMRIYEQFINPEKMPVDVSDMSLLTVSLTWGALLDSDVSLGSRVALLDTMLETSKLLLQQNSSVRQFLALVAVLSLVEKTGSNHLPTLVFASVSTAASLGLHIESILRSICISDEQAICAKRAIWILYCIDKSYALRWEALPLISDSSLPTLNPPNTTLQTDSLAASSLQWLKIRFQYSKICSNILQLRTSAEEELPRDQLNAAWALSTTLEEWYTSDAINLLVCSLNKNDATQIKLQISYYYHELRFQLMTICLPDPRSSLSVGSEECRELLSRSVREIITSSSTIPSENLLQDHNHLFINTLALCLLAMGIVTESGQDCGKEKRALLSIVAGFFARFDIVFPQSCIFTEVYSLVEILTYR